MTTNLLPIEAGALDPSLDRQLIADIRGASENEDAALSENTRRAYATGWRQYEAWCRSRYLQPLAANPEQIATFISSLVPSGGDAQRKLSTIKLRLAAIKHHLRGEGVSIDWKHPALARQLRGIARRNPKLVREEPVEAMTLADLETLIAAIPEDLRGRRDRALILVGFAGALRRSEIVGIEVEHMTAVEGGYEIWLGQTKTEQGTSDNVAVIAETGSALCPVRALNSWFEASGIIEGPVFRGFQPRSEKLRPTAMSDQMVRHVLVQRAGEAGLDVRIAQKGGREVQETVRWGGHSLRRGMATMLSQATGGDVKSVQPAGLWKSAVTALRYIDASRTADKSASAVVMGKVSGH